jgi:DNA-binding response OmpR family regulator
MAFKILCIEDDPTIQVLIRASLKDHLTDFSENLSGGRRLLERQRYDALILDIDLPDGDGLRFFVELSHDERYAELPVFFLSGHKDIPSKVLALQTGAYDYISKPFDPLELSVRVTSRLNRVQKVVKSTGLKRLGQLEIDLEKLKAFSLASGTREDLQLTAIEIRLLHHLVARPERVFSRDQLLEALWGDTHVSSRTVDSHISHLRKKVAACGVAIESVKGEGYRAVSSAPPTAS